MGKPKKVKRPARVEFKPKGKAQTLCGSYMGDNDGTCPNLRCVRRIGHDGLCDNVRGDS